jgi:hypothetical protein
VFGSILNGDHRCCDSHLTEMNRLSAPSYCDEQRRIALILVETLCQSCGCFGLTRSLYGVFAPFWSSDNGSTISGWFLFLIIIFAWSLRNDREFDLKMRYGYIGHDCGYKPASLNICMTSDLNSCEVYPQSVLIIQLKVMLPKSFHLLERQRFLVSPNWHALGFKPFPVNRF